jgi:hypothetical protein
MGVGYSVWDRSLCVWSGDNLEEGERQFEAALQNGSNSQRLNLT